MEDCFGSFKKEKSDKEEDLLPNFIKGERGEHFPELIKKQTKAPRNYTEASLLRSMETAGKQVDDEIEVTVPSGDKFYLVSKIQFI